MLSDLRLLNFRCFERATVELSPGLNLFRGPNGEGKTSLLEAACVLLRLQSQRSSSLAPAIQAGKTGFALRGNFGAHQLEFRYAALRRTVRFDAVEQRTFGEYLRVARVVSFANSDIELVRGSADARRRYLDFLGAQVDSGYRRVLRAYERALRARNHLLKSASSRLREIAAYDQPLIEHGSLLLRMRARLAAAIAPQASAAYARISRGQEQLAIRFLPGAGEDFADELASSAGQQARLRQTVVGPHRDELALSVGGMPAAQFASEGQQRSAALALKIAQAEVLRQHAQSPPLLLVDDIFGELDPERRNALLDNLPVDAQKLVTATTIPWRSELNADAVYELRNRQLTTA